MASGYVISLSLSLTSLPQIGGLGWCLSTSGGGPQVSRILKLLVFSSLLLLILMISGAVVP